MTTPVRVDAVELVVTAGDTRVTVLRVGETDGWKIYTDEARRFPAAVFTETFKYGQAIAIAGEVARVIEEWRLATASATEACGAALHALGQQFEEASSEAVSPCA